MKTAQSYTHNKNYLNDKMCNIWGNEHRKGPATTHIPCGIKLIFFQFVAIDEKFEGNNNGIIVRWM